MKFQVVLLQWYQSGVAAEDPMSVEEADRKMMGPKGDLLRWAAMSERKVGDVFASARAADRWWGDPCWAIVVRGEDPPARDIDDHRRYAYGRPTEAECSSMDAS